MHDATPEINAKPAPDSCATAVVLTMEGTRRTASFFAVKGLDPKRQEWIVVPLNNPDADPSRLPLVADIDEETGLAAHMICKTPQLAWEYAKMHGHKVKPCTNEAA
ncbi:hypothetical protein QD336_00030 [Rhizobium sp. BR 250]